MTAIRIASATRFDTDLAWLDRLVELEILRLRAHYDLSLDELRGLYISDRQVDELLRQTEDGAATADSLTSEAERLARSGDTRLDVLAARFNLAPEERDALLIALAPELSLKYETLYAYLNNDITRKHATVDLAIRLLRNQSPAETIRLHLRAGGRLFETGLLEMIEAGPERHSRLAQGFALAPSVSDYLLDAPLGDPRLPAGVELTAAPAPGSLAPSAYSAVEQFAACHPVVPGVVMASGDSTAELRAAAGIYAIQYGYAVLALPFPTVAEASGWPVLRTRLSLLAALAPAVIVLYDDGLLHEPQRPAHASRVVSDLSSAGACVLVASPRHGPFAISGEIPFLELTLPESSAAERTLVWRTALEEFGVPAEAAQVEEIGDRFALSYTRIRAAAASAARLASNRANPEARCGAMWHAARKHSSQSLAQLASRVVKPHRWEHLVLPDTTFQQVREIASAVRNRNRVFQDWRMAERTGRGNGLMILFAGASGTGKTMTAAVIANDLGVDLFRIDLAAVVSKYIGETEKNLDRVFEAARRSNAILLFDEAEALLGKRSEVKDAHDRYANIEVAYLLQKMEEHDGVVILATNLSKNLDQAFARRMHYVVEFPRPNAPLRRRLWEGMFPPEAPLADDVDLAFLAEQFETSGGEIQTVALDAAFLASASDGPIEMTHIIQAMARHELKRGNPAGLSGFKHYYGMVRGG